MEAVEDSEATTTGLPMRLSVRFPGLLRSWWYARRADPSARVEIGTFIHAVEGEMLCASTMPSKVRKPLIHVHGEELLIAPVP